MRSVVILAVSAAVAATPAEAAFDRQAPLAAIANQPTNPLEVAVAPDGALLAAYGNAGATVVRERSAAGLLSAPQPLVAGAPLAVQAALRVDGGALVAVSTDGGSVVVERPAGGRFGAPEVLGGTGSRVQALAVDPAGNAAVVLGERTFAPDARLVLRLQPAGGRFGPPVVLANAEATARLAFGSRGAFAVAWAVQGASFTGIRVEARTGTVSGDLGRRTVIARKSRGISEVDDADVAVTRDGRAMVAYASNRDTGTDFVHGVHVASTGSDGRFGPPRTLAGADAFTPRVAAAGATVAVAWSSTSPRSGRAGIRVALRRAGGAFAPDQLASAPVRGFGARGRGPRVPGATEAYAAAPEVAVSRRGDVAVTYVARGDFHPGTVLAAVHAHDATLFDGPQPISALGDDASPLPPVWTRDAALMAPSASGTALNVAVRPAGSPPQRRPRDRQAPRVRASAPTVRDLRAGAVATRVTCAEACALTSRAQVNVAGDIGKPRGAATVVLRAGQSTVVALPLQKSQRQRLAAGQARVRAILALAVVDRLGNARTVRARLCVPRRTPC